MWYGDGWGSMGSWGWGGMFLMLLFGFGMIALIAWSIMGSRPGQNLATSDGLDSDRGLTILRERYARGEVTTEEFEQARETLDETRR